MKNWSAAVLVLCCAMAAMVANAADDVPPSSESVEKLLGFVMQPDPKTYIRVVSGPMRNAYAETLLKMKYENPSARQTNDVYRTVSDAFEKSLTWEVLRPQLIAAFSNFTQAEVDGLIAFYTSPVGKAWIAKQPTSWFMMKDAIDAQSRLTMTKPSAEIVRLLEQPRK